MTPPGTSLDDAGVDITDNWHSSNFDAPVPPPIDRRRHSWRECLTRLTSRIILVALPSFYASKAFHLGTSIQAHFVMHDITRDSRESEILSTTGSPSTINDLWIKYLNTRVSEWKIIFTLACALVGLSLTMYQIPQAATYPVTYAFTSLCQYRAIVGLLYAVILCVYFESGDTRTATFAIMWWRSVEESRDKMWNSWTMFSLPAASTIWAMIFYVLAILSFIFRPTVPVLDNYTIPFTLNVILQVIVIASLLSDLVCFFYVYITLRDYKRHPAACDDA